MIEAQGHGIPSRTKALREFPFGWATESLVRLDDLAPGLLRRLLTSSPLTRQACFLVLAERVGHAASTEAAERALARSIRDGRAREVIRLGVGAVSDGLLGALLRVGPAPMSTPTSHLRLCRLFLSPAHSRAAEALRYAPRITEQTLEIIDALDPRWLHSETLKRLRTRADAEAFNDAVELAQRVCSAASDEAVHAAISNLQRGVPLTSVTMRFIRRADRFPSQPRVPHPDIRPLVSAHDLLEVSRRYENCVRHHLSNALDGKVAFAEFRDEAVLEFFPLSSGGWLLNSVNVAQNALVPELLEAEARRACHSAEVPFVDHPLGRWEAQNPYMPAAARLG